MKIFDCPVCSSSVYFDNDTCVHCGTPLGFDPLTLRFQNMNSAPEYSEGASFHYCANHKHQACNWAIQDTYPETFCLACYLNNTIPNLDGTANLPKWKKMEMAKRRLLYGLYKLNLPIEKKASSEAIGLLFDFMEDNSPSERVMTGHSNGLITINIEEADELERLHNKIQLDEKYRTILGHFRHEVGHYYWDVFFDQPEALSKFRGAFGDESTDYGLALKNHYAQGTPANWEQNHISPYAAAHPWEDWAETWAHYLHLMDTLETAYYFGISVQPTAPTLQPIGRFIDRSPYTIADFDEVMKMWHPLTLAMNSLNRSMGHSDFYCFHLSPVVISKLAFIHTFCWKYRKQEA